MIRQHRLEAQYPPTIETMCHMLGISPASYYRHKEGDTRKITEKITMLKDMVIEVFHLSGDTLGYRRLYDRMKKQLVHVPDLMMIFTPRLVRLIMHREGLIAKHERRKQHKAQYRSSNYRPDMIDHLKRDFHSDTPGVKLCGDITHIPTQEGPVKLATVMDLYNREIIGHAFSTQVDTPLIIEAFGNALHSATISARAIFHSDRGSNYTSDQFRFYLYEHDIIPSVGATGSCLDNAVAESFFSTLKTERTYDQKYATHQEAITDITYYIDYWYNKERPHSTLNYQSPHHYKQQAAQTLKN